MLYGVIQSLFEGEADFDDFFDHYSHVQST